jgi:hypothetical protein
LRTEAQAHEKGGYESLADYRSDNDMDASAGGVVCFLNTIYIYDYKLF